MQNSNEDSKEEVMETTTSEANTSIQKENDFPKDESLVIYVF